MSEIKSSGEKREFGTGSHRDASVGKGRMDLLPASSVLKVMSVTTGEETLAIKAGQKMDYCSYLTAAYQYALRYMNGDTDRDYLVLAAKSAIIATGQFESIKANSDDRAAETNNPRQCFAFGLKQLSQHYEAGAIKYGENNWQLGQPMSVLLDSGMRHNVKAIAEIIDEPHCRAAAWNYLCAVWMEDNKPELQNIESRIKA